jgi:hypothetical protein
MDVLTRRVSIVILTSRVGLDPVVHEAAILCQPMSTDAERTRDPPYRQGMPP